MGWGEGSLVFRPESGGSEAWGSGLGANELLRKAVRKEGGLIVNEGGREAAHIAVRYRLSPPLLCQ